MAPLKKENDVLRCSFCGKSQKEVKNLIGGAAERVYICNECVEICDEIIADDADYRDSVQRQEPATGQAHITRSSVPPRVRCSLCRTFVAMEEVLRIPERGYLCAACKIAVQAALECNPVRAKARRSKRGDLPFAR